MEGDLTWCMIDSRMHVSSYLYWFTLRILSFYCYYNEFAFFAEKMTRVQGESIKGPCFVWTNAAVNTSVELNSRFTFIGGCFCGIKRTFGVAASLGRLSLSPCLSKDCEVNCAAVSLAHEMTNGFWGRTKWLMTRTKEQPESVSPVYTLYYL